MHKGDLHRGCAGLSADFGFCGSARAEDRSPLDAMADGTVSDGEALGRAIAIVANLMAPPLVILAGQGGLAGAALLGPLRRAFLEALSPPLARRIELVTDDRDDDAWARGAAALVLRDLYGAPWGTTGPRPAHSHLAHGNGVTA
jgi:hypothetical protein